MALNLKQKKPEVYEGKRDHIMVDSWIYSVERYQILIIVGSQKTIYEFDEIRYATTLFSGSAASWWLLIVQNNLVPTICVDCFNFLRKEFFPFDSERLDRDKLYNFRQVTSVVDYIKFFWEYYIEYPRNE